MKSKTWLIIGLALIIITLGATGCDTITPPASSGVPSAASSQQNTGIWVTGEGKVTAVPDIAILSLGVEAQADTTAQAQSDASVAMDAVFRELDAHDVADKDIQTRHFSIYPVRRWVPEEEKEVLIGYRVSNMVTAKIREADKTGTIIEAVARVSGDYIRINDISFTVDDPAPYQQEAREKAMADAEAKAKQLADAAGVKLGTPTYINESSGYTTVFRGDIAFAEAAPAPPISPGETEISLNVQVAYSIR